MSARRAYQSAFTLFEIVVVVAIVLVVAAVVWNAVAPRAKAASQESVAANDLRQFVAGLHLYTADNDGELPLWPASLQKPTPTRITNIKFFIGNPLYYRVQGYGDIVLTRNYAAKRAERLLTEPRYPWDDSIYPIARSPILKEVGAKRSRSMPLYSSCGRFNRFVPVDRVVSLAGFMDGHVAWSPSPTDYEAEIADCIPQVIRELFP